MRFDDKAELDEFVGHLFEDVWGQVQMTGPGGLDTLYKLEDGHLEVRLAPALTELAGASPHDGKVVYAFIHNVDVSAIGGLFADVQIDCGEFDGVTELSFTGKYRGVDTWLLIEFEPFDDAEAESVTRL